MKIVKMPLWRKTVVLLLLLAALLIATILASVDEKSYSAKVKFMGLEKDIHMGDHPILWSNCVSAGRTVYTAVGHHNADAFDNAEHRLPILR